VRTAAAAAAARGACGLCRETGRVEGEG
jgi:hypothetical protein